MLQSIRTDYRGRIRGRRTRQKPASAPAPTPSQGPTGPEILAMISHKDLVPAAQRINQILHTCASDVSVDLADAFVKAVAPVLRNTGDDLRGTDRKTVKTAMNGCLRRLSAELKPAEKAKLHTFLQCYQLEGTINKHFNGAAVRTGNA